VNNDSIENLSKDYSFDLDTMTQVLEDYAKTKSDKSSLSLTENGKLIYTCQVSFGRLYKDFGFSINLDKQDANHYSKQDLALGPNTDENVNKLSIRVSKIEETLEKILKLNEERFNAFERTIIRKLETFENTINNSLEVIKRLEQNRPNVEIENLDWRFISEGKFASKFHLTKNNKAAISKEDASSVIWTTFPLPEDKISKFTFAVIKGGSVEIGIAPEEDLTNEFKIRPTISYHCAGTVYIMGKFKGNILPQYNDSDKVSFEVDLKSGRVIIQLNNKNVYEYVIENTNYAYYPFLCTSKGTHGAQFI